MDIEAEASPREPQADAAEERALKRYFRIAEVAAELGVAQSVLRFWEKEFPEIQPRKTRTGHRKYSRKDFALVRSIHYLVKVRKFTLDGAREALRADASGVAMRVFTRQTLLHAKGLLEQIRAKL
jgi:DNA-binding transcriptional MerR regulator